MAKDCGIKKKKSLISKGGQCDDAMFLRYKLKSKSGTRLQMVAGRFFFFPPFFVSLSVLLRQSRRDLLADSYFESHPLLFLLKFWVHFNSLHAARCCRFHSPVTVFLSIKPVWVTCVWIKLTPLQLQLPLPLSHVCCLGPALEITHWGCWDAEEQHDH